MACRTFNHKTQSCLLQINICLKRLPFDTTRSDQSFTDYFSDIPSSKKVVNKTNHFLLSSPDLRSLSDLLFINVKKYLDSTGLRLKTLLRAEHREPRRTPTVADIRQSADRLNVLTTPRPL